MPTFPPRQKIRIAIVDDHPAILVGLRSMLSEEDFLEVVASFQHGKEIEAADKELRPDVILLDLRMPGISGIDCIPLLRKSFPQARILIISSHDVDEEIFRALEAGALGFITKSATLEEMSRAIRTVYAGNRSLPPGIAQRLNQRHHHDELTARELDILKSVARGHTSKHIAQALGISEFTVRNHVNHIISKLGAQDRTDAAVLGLRRGLIRFEEMQ